MVVNKPMQIIQYCTSPPLSNRQIMHIHTRFFVVANIHVHKSSCTYHHILAVVRKAADVSWSRQDGSLLELVISRLTPRSNSSVANSAAGLRLDSHRSSAVLHTFPTIGNPLYYSHFQWYRGVFQHIILVFFKPYSLKTALDCIYLYFATQYSSVSKIILVFYSCTCVGKLIFTPFSNIYNSFPLKDFSVSEIYW